MNSGGTLTAVTPPQQLVVTQVGSGSVSWSASSDQAWLKVTPASPPARRCSRSTSRTPAGFPASGTLQGTITLSSADVENSPQYLDVDFQLKAPGTSTVPFGAVDTPADGTTGITGAIPVTGWALDDVGINRVEVWRDPVPGFETSGSPNGKIFLGQAYLVAGARPDVEALYEGTMPRPQLAGWGFMVLTNFLPDRTVVPTQPVGGNGSFVLHAYAVDIEGHTTLLGSKAITCDNAHATTPFGTIDTPSQGGTASGASFVNFGWALTPLPADDSDDGSTLSVLVDGVPLGHPTYNQYRSDVAGAFPGYNNSNGAVGFRVIDTTALSNGVHTIGWLVYDNLGRGDGIGSRFFSVANGSGDLLAEGAPVGFGDLGQAYGRELGRPLAALGMSSEVALPDVNRRPLEAVEIPLPGLGERGENTSVAAYSVGGGQLGRLPVGARFDGERRTLSWSPAAGFVGNYRFVFVEQKSDGTLTARPVTVRLQPS